jgi:hypothetical protein
MSVGTYCTFHVSGTLLVVELNAWLTNTLLANSQPQLSTTFLGHAPAACTAIPYACSGGRGRGGGGWCGVIRAN